MKAYPTISILTNTYNPDLALFEKSLQSIKAQDYPRNKLEHIVLDGGSEEKMLDLARNYGCDVLVKKKFKINAEGRKVFGIKKAKHDIIFWLEADNVLPDKHTLASLVRPFLEHEYISYTYTLHYAYRRDKNFLDRYCSLVGSSDPVAMYLKKTDREAWSEQSTTKGTILNYENGYDIVAFSRKDLPTVGANGFMIRRNVLLQAHLDPKTYLHTDIILDLINKGFTKFGVVNNTSIDNLFAEKLLSHVRKRTMYLQQYSLTLQIAAKSLYMSCHLSAFGFPAPKQSREPSLSHTRSEFYQAAE